MFPYDSRSVFMCDTRSVFMCDTRWLLPYDARSVFAYDPTRVAFPYDARAAADALLSRLPGVPAPGALMPRPLISVPPCAR
ncbi:hypothetical protein CK936_10515 [Streptomyces albireticuli]|uniref:Uncharacterized protein n=1 Tax=Streptomyces albireticuli TaxID=1940 RepID=A0A2A2DBR0_9ACTN|nr:hypothetical protein CK936_10515 [Streptomyces albireticuli]